MELHSVKLWVKPNSEPAHVSPNPRAAEARHELDTARRVRALAYQGHPSLEAALVAPGLDPVTKAQPRRRRLRTTSNHEIGHPTVRGTMHSAAPKGILCLPWGC